MKKIALIGLLLMVFTLGCEDPGVSAKKLMGDEDMLPQELKGLQVYSVSCGGGEYVKVAVFNNQINSATYSEGKTTETTIIVNKGEYNERTIYVKEILSETDDIIVLKKK